jgi:hypothetical protein
MRANIMPKLDLIDWVVRKAQRLSSEKRESNAADPIPSLDKFFTIARGGPLENAFEEEPSAETLIPSASMFQTRVGIAVEVPLVEEAAVWDEPHAANLAAVTPRSSSTSHQAQDEVASLPQFQGATQEPDSLVQLSPASTAPITGVAVQAALIEEAAARVEPEAPDSPAVTQRSSSTSHQAQVENAALPQLQAAGQETEPAAQPGPASTIRITGVGVQAALIEEAAAWVEPVAAEPPVVMQRSSSTSHQAQDEDAALPELQAAIREAEPFARASPFSTIGITELSVQAGFIDEAAAREPDAAELPIIAQSSSSTTSETQDEAAALPELLPVAQIDSPSLVHAKNDVPEPPLLRAIRNRDIHTRTVDRNRAIALRWALRDIKARRFVWSPVREDDLQTLKQYGLIEVQNSVPVLTPAGASVVD